MRRADLRGASLRGANLIGADLYEADLREGTIAEKDRYGNLRLLQHDLGAVRTARRDAATPPIWSAPR